MKLFNTQENQANDLTGCTRGTAAPYRGATPPATTAGTHASGAKVYGSYLATASSNNSSSNGSYNPLQ
jgi:hypothetical protein